MDRPNTNYTYFYMFNFCPLPHNFSNATVDGLDAEYEPENWAKAINSTNFRKAFLYGINNAVTLAVQAPEGYENYKLNTVTPPSFCANSEGVDYLQCGDLANITEFFDEAKANAVEIVKPNFSLTAEDIHTDVTEVVKAAKKLVDLIGADYIVSVGRGISKDVEGGIKLAEELAEVLGGVVGGSRATIDSGWLSADHQVGQTGKTVHPKVYIALGISGAIQHVAGMQDSELIVAINTNESAPIFEITDVGIVGDLYKVIPAIIEELDKVEAKD